LEEDLDFDEGHRAEVLKDLAYRYRWLLVASAIAVAVGIGAGYGYYQHQKAQIQGASEAYGTAMQALQAGREGDARQALQTLVDQYGGTTYGAFARVFRARLLYQGGQASQALGMLKPLVDGEVGPPEARHIAVEEQARIQWAQGKDQAALATLGSLEGKAYLPGYFLLKGDILADTGKPDAARKAYKEARLHPGADALAQTIKDRLQALSASSKGDDAGGQDG